MAEMNTPYKASTAIALMGLILAVISIATPEWTKESGVTIGLWTVTDENGDSFSWLSSGLYEGDYVT